MKVIYMLQEGIAAVEDTRTLKRLIEVKGGDYHPMVPSAVLRDEERRFPPIMIIWQTVRWPEGAEASEGEFPALEANVAKEFHQRVSVSKRWARSVMRWSWFFFKMMVLGFVVGFVILMVVFAGAVF
jgi:hypothetical protein